MSRYYESDPIMDDEVYHKQHACSRKGLIAAILVGAACLVLGVIIGWFSHKVSPVPSSGSSTASFDAASFIIQNLNKDNIKENLREYTSKTRLPGSVEDRELAERIEQQWRSSGIDDVHLATYNVLSSFPNDTSPNKVQILDSLGQAVFTSAAREKPLTPGENYTHIVPPYNAFAPAGVAVGELVYVNYGRVEDFQFLTQNLSMNLTGKILIARYGKIFRGDKVNAAAVYGASGLILYSDPADVNSDPTADPYPHSWWLPPSGLQRGTVGSDGDYQTPLYPSTDYAYRIPVSKLETLPKVPTQPIGYGDAKHLLEQLGGNHTAPPSWQGGLNITYRLGPGFTNTSLKARVEVNNFLTLSTAYNVIGYIHGDVEPDRYVMLGNHHDAWAFGAVDPLSGTAALTDVVRVFGKMLQQGHRPRRTIVFCSWDMEEPALKGSTEYVEDKMKVIYERAVAYLNVDYAVDFPYTVIADTSPLLQDPMYAAAKKVPSPEKDGTLYELWRTRPLNSANPIPAEPELNYGLGADSDYAAFYQRAGVPSVDVWFTYDQNRFSAISYPLYHSAYDTFYAYSNFIDPNFNYTLAMGQFWAVLASDLANAELLNMNVTRYANALRTFVDAILKQFKDVWQEKGINSGAFDSSVENFTRSANDFAASLSDLDLTKIPPLKLRMLNDQIMQLERAFIDPEGLPSQPQHKHIVFAPSRFDEYASNKFPGIVDTMYDLQQNKTSDWDLLKKQVYIATYMVQSAANTLSGLGL